MNKAERQQLILNRINTDHHVYISDLCDEMEVSYDSIRRDITELDAAGKVKRVHGGAIANDGLPHEYVNRSDLESTTKRMLAHKAVRLFHDGDSLLIDGGTTNMELIRQLPEDKHFTIFTNSLPVASEFCDRKNLTINYLGGRVFPTSRITVGASVVEALQVIRADWYSMGVCAINGTDGVSDFDYDECLTKRAMVRSARNRLIMVDSSKLNTSDSYITARLSDIDYMFVEDDKTESIKNGWPVGACHVM